MTVKLCSCGLVHDTLVVCSRARRLHESGFLPQPNEAKQVATTASAPKIKTILGHPSDQVLIEKAEKKPVSANVVANVTKSNKAEKKVSANATRQAAFKSKRVAAGIVPMKIWAHIDDMAAIKKFAKELDANRSKVS